MTIGTFGISALQEIRKIEGFENAVIAGGFVRDHLLGGEFKDVDIFVPCSDPRKFRDTFIKPISKTLDLQYTAGTSSLTGYTAPLSSLMKPKMTSVSQTFGGFTELQYKDREYRITERGLGNIKGKYAGTVDVDIVAYDHPNDENFGMNVVKEFNYWIDMVYFDGIEVVTTKEFEKDRRSWTATLCRLTNIEQLPGAFHKFLRLQQKYKDFHWATNCLELKGKKEEDKKTDKKKILTGGEVRAAIDLERDARERRAEIGRELDRAVPINNDWIIIDEVPGAGNNQAGPIDRDFF